MKSFVLLLLLAFICSCAATLPVKREPKKVSPGAEREFRSAESLAQKGDSKKAMPRLKKFVQQNPETELTADAYFQMAQLHQNSQQYQEALNNYLAIINMPVASPLETEAGLRAAKLQLKLGQMAEADKLIDRASRGKNLTPEQQIELEKLRLESALAQKRHLLAIESLVLLTEKHPQPAEREKYRAQAQESLDSRLSEDELREVADGKRFSFLQSLAKFRYGVLMADQRQYSRARDYLVGAAELVPDTELAERANRLVAQIDSRHRVDPRTIGVVLPLSGKQAAIGYKALRGIQLGLGVFGRSPQFKLAIVDSEGNPDTARRAVERLVQEDNVIAMIGGLLSKTATTEAAKAQEFGVPMILLTQKAGITQAGDFIFRNALTSQMQVQMLVDTAMDKMGLRNFAILYPNDAYGVEFANLFWDEVRSRNGGISGVQPYDPQETDFRGHVQRLVGTYYYEDRADEFRLYAKAHNEKNPKRSSRQGGPSLEELLPPIVDFDAIFIPDSAKAVGQIAPMLAYNNVSGVRLLGTNIWNSPALISRGQKFVEGAVFVDSYLNADPSFVNSEFHSSFKATFDEDPGFTEVQSFDSALILRQVIVAGASTRTGLRERLSGLQNMPGALGRLSVNGEREFVRPLSALTVRDGKIMGFDGVRR